MPALKKSSAEQREERRHPFHWPVAIVFDSTDEQQTFHGVTHDISLSGCAVLTEHNIFNAHPVSILLSAPSEHAGTSRRIVEVKARMVYTVLSAGHRRFRCGIQFLNFKGAGRATLNRIVEQRAVQFEF